MPRIFNRKIRSDLATILIIVALYFLTVHLNNKRLDWENDDMLIKLEDVANEKFELMIEKFESGSRWQVEVISGKRTKERQAELKEENPKNASPETSKHVKGLAIDINLYNPFTFKRIKKSSLRNEWEETGIVSIAKELGLEWGGDFKTYYDPVHFEMP